MLLALSAFLKHTFLVFGFHDPSVLVRYRAISPPQVSKVETREKRKNNNEKGENKTPHQLSRIEHLSE
jgi:hypothetical protein